MENHPVHPHLVKPSNIEDYPQFNWAYKIKARIILQRFCRQREMLRQFCRYVCRCSLGGRRWWLQCVQNTRQRHRRQGKRESSNC